MKGRLAETQHCFLWELAQSPRELSGPDPGGYLRRLMDLEPADHISHGSITENRCQRTCVL